MSLARRLCAGVAVLLTGAALSAQVPRSAGLRIVVIAGEDAVNVIQQHTAVAPIVEVRDRNDQPVAGVLVVFSTDSRAAFGTARSVTVTTNAAGRAEASGLTPLRAGRLNIQVRANHQGQAATASIRQDNVATAADVSSVAGMGAAGAGGLSALTIGAIAGGGAVGSVLGVRALTDDDAGTTPQGPTLPLTLSGPFSGTETLTVSPPGCQVTATDSGIMTVTIQSQTGTTIAATGRFVRDLSNPSPPCGGFAVTTNSNVPFTLGNFAGPQDRLDFRQASSGTNGISSATTNIGFTGQWTGLEITGTLTYQNMTTFLASGVTVSGSLSVPVTLR